MLDQHATLRQELKRAEHLLDLVRAYHDRMSPSANTIPETDSPQLISDDNTAARLS